MDEEDWAAVRAALQNELHGELARRHLSQEEMAHEIGVGQSAVSYWLRGVRLPDLPRLAAIAHWLGIPPIKLLIRIFGYEDCEIHSRDRSLEEQIATADMEECVRLLGLISKRLDILNSRIK
jgi:transcriptional regulator with XRE-family HTH domain